ncbi:MAG: alanyl-tRNA editing protein [Oscillospiraceae bacterium]|nr:alanyl-tRNA editing protein [Oscillospiraceae bacterium]
MAEKLFYNDSLMTDFTAVVKSCVQTENGWQVTLDRTAFYPEGGGQPADKGTLGGKNVLDVREKEGEVIHLIDGELELGAQVQGCVDGEYRFDLMQQHTGEHIVSGIINELYGWDNVGFHMGSEFVTIDLNGELTAEQLKEVEKRANEAVYKNLPVEVLYPTADELKAMNYRSKKELSGQVRIVRIAGYDMCACCGTHLPTTGMTGAIKLISSQKYKGGTRVAMLCGRRAMQDYGTKNESVAAISALTSTKPYEVVQAVERLLAEQEQLKQKLAAARKQIFAALVEKTESAQVVWLFEDDLTPGDLNQLCQLLCKKGVIAAALSGSDDSGYKYAIGSSEADVRAIGKEFNAALSGRGGGQKAMVQGSCTASRSQIEDFLNGIKVNE